MANKNKHYATEKWAEIKEGRRQQNGVKKNDKVEGSGYFVGGENGETLYIQAISISSIIKYFVNNSCKHMFGLI